MYFFVFEQKSAKIANKILRPEVYSELWPVTRKQDTWEIANYFFLNFNSSLLKDHFETIWGEKNYTPMSPLGDL